MEALMGGGGKRDNGATQLAKQNAEKQQRRSLAQLAASQAESDQATSNPGGGKKRGSKMLTFLSGSGQDTLG